MKDQYRDILDFHETYMKQISDMQKPLIEAMQPLIEAQRNILEMYSPALRESALAMSSSLQSALAPLLTESVHNMILESQIITSNLANVMIHAFKDIDFHAFISECSSANESECYEDDYVTFDDTVVKELDITESIIVPIGSNRVRMKTSDFIALLTVIVTVLTFIYSATVERLDTASNNATTEQLIEIEQERNLIERERNELLSSFISSIDCSETKNQELLEELNESLLNLQSEISGLKDTVQDSPLNVSDSGSPSQVLELDSDNHLETSDNTSKSLCTESEN